MGWLSDFFLGSEGKIDWDELQEMVKLQAQINKTDRAGVFTGWEWEKDPDGNPTGRQVQTINPAFQGAVDRLGGRAVQGHTDYRSPGQFSSLLDAKMSTQMQKHGIPPGSEGTSPWQPAAERPGLSQEAYLPPPPPGDGTEPPGFDKPAAPLPPGDTYAPGNAPEDDPMYGLPPDYYNDKGNIKRKYRPDHKAYVGDEFLDRWKDPNYQFDPLDPNNPAEWYDKNGTLKKQYRMIGGG